MPEKKYIRFISSDYKTLFHLPDGGRIRITYPDREPAERVCRFIDEYHTDVGGYCPAPLTVLSTQGRSTVLRLRPRGLRGARSIAFSDSGRMKAASLMLAASFSGAII